MRWYERKDQITAKREAEGEGEMALRGLAAQDGAVGEKGGGRDRDFKGEWFTGSSGTEIEEGGVGNESADGGAKKMGACRLATGQIQVRGRAGRWVCGRVGVGSGLEGVRLRLRCQKRDVEQNGVRRGVGVSEAGCGQGQRAARRNRGGSREVEPAVCDQPDITVVCWASSAGDSGGEGVCVAKGRGRE